MFYADKHSTEAELLFVILFLLLTSPIVASRRYRLTSSHNIQITVLRAKDSDLTAFVTPLSKYMEMDIWPGVDDLVSVDEFIHYMTCTQARAIMF